LGSGLTFTPSDPSLTNLTLTPGQTGSITFTVTTPVATWNAVTSYSNGNICNTRAQYSH
jgi:hypothetical protein